MLVRAIYDTEVRYKSGRRVELYTDQLYDLGEQPIVGFKGDERWPQVEYLPYRELPCPHCQAHDDDKAAECPQCGGSRVYYPDRVIDVSTVAAAKASKAA